LNIFAKSRALILAPSSERNESDQVAIARNTLLAAPFRRVIQQDLAGMRDVSLGFRVHSGWAIMIVLSGDGVIERRRIVLAGDGLPVQPYHAAEPLPFAEAEQLIGRCSEAARQLAVDAVEPVRQARAACVLSSSGRPLPDLASVLASHALIHAAEGELYRDALREAAAQFGIPLVTAREKDALGQLAAGMRVRIDSYGKLVGPPWRQDEKLATAAAYLAQGKT
jgi:hypothetical protein